MPSASSFAAGCGRCRPPISVAPAVLRSHPPRRQAVRCFACHQQPRAGFQQQQQQQQQQQLEQAQPANSLQGLLVWLVRNGVTGIGYEHSKVALYEELSGERGLLCEQALSAGEVVVRVPLRLAITDVADEALHPAWSGKACLPQDRLVGKLLRERSHGSASPWAPYLQALPRHVPCAVLHYTEQQAAECQLPRLQQQLQQQRQRLQALYQQLPREALYGADWPAFQWAHSVVMSRTFGNASASGGIGVRMLCPLIDFLNHAGDQTRGLAADDPQAHDNVRWDVVSPAHSAGGGWEMVLTATAAIEAGAPVLLSYFEGSNDEFLLHYGFVPACNPHDVAALAPNLRQALEQCWRADAAELAAQGAPLRPLAQRYSAALDAGLALLQQEVVAAAAPSSGDDWVSLEALECVVVARCGGVSGWFVAALEALHGGDMARVRLALATACWQQLAGLETHLLQDLALLAADVGELQQPGAYLRALLHYHQALAQTWLPDVAARPASGGRAPDAGAAVHAAAALAIDVLTASSSGVGDDGGGGGGSSSSSTTTTTSSRSSAGGGGGGGRIASWAAAAGIQTTDAAVAGGFLPLELRSAVAYRASKKQLLWDAVLACSVSPEAVKGRAAAAEQAGVCGEWEAQLEP